MFFTQYLVKLKDIDIKQIFDLVDKLQTNPVVEYVEPNFIRFLKPFTNDPYYNSQWSINNQGYLGGTVDADMDVDQAWTLTTGQGVKVSIIDEGVDLTHPDLTPNLLQGYDATGNNSGGAPNENNNDAHGTACAGIIAAIANNNTGIAGTAYNSKIIPVRIAYSNGYPLGDYRRAWITNDTWIANGINWAVQQGADILSNSWGGGSPSNTITNAINNAVNNGRNGKGCVVLFALGNFNTSVSYPATLNNVIAVGASSMCDERKTPSSYDGENWWGSNYGAEIDVVAPGVKIYTTDISGSAGYNSGDYKSDFNGTSSACPNAAGVAALVLSVNPNFTQSKVKEILESSTDKPSGYSYSNHTHGSWNEEVGYGSVNAYKALKAAIYISGSSTVCTSNSTFTLQNRPPNSTVTWTHSSNLTQVGGNTGTTYTVKARNSYVSGQAWVKANVNGTIITKTFRVGKPSFTIVGDNFITDEEYGYASLSNVNGDITSINWYFYAPIVGENISGSARYWLENTENSGESSISAIAKNACGSTQKWFEVEYHVFGWYMSISPNPARSETTIALKNNSKEEDFDETAQWDIEIYNQSYMLQDKKSKLKGNIIRINTSSWKEGIYYIKATYKDEIISEKLIIKR